MVNLAPARVIGWQAHVEERPLGTLAVDGSLIDRKPRRLSIHDVRILAHSACSGVRRSVGGEGIQCVYSEFGPNLHRLSHSFPGSQWQK